MVEITLYGFPQSTFVRSARLALAEKGIAYELVPVYPGTPELVGLHPFGRIPALRHGELVLFESLAICRYVDEAFDGPSLQPADPVPRAVMTQWVSAVSDSVYSAVIGAYVLPLFLARMRKQEPDRAALDAALPALEKALGVVDDACAKADYLAGSDFTLADMFLFPIVHAASQTPGARERVEACSHLMAWFGRVSARPSAVETDPSPASRSA